MRVRKDGTLESQAVNDGGGSLTVDGAIVASTPTAPATSATSNVSNSVTSVTVLSSNAAREMAIIYNDSIVDSYVKLGTTAATNSFTVKIPGSGYYQLPLTRNGVYTGRIDAISTVASGSLRVTEITA